MRFFERNPRVDAAGGEKDLEDILNLMQVAEMKEKGDIVRLASGFYPEARVSGKLLLAVDHSPNGRFALRLAGLIAATRGMPITVIPVGEETVAPSTGKRKEPRSTEDEHPAKQAVADAAEEGKSKRSETEQKVEVTVRKPDLPGSDAVTEEARKGYDLLLIGLARTRSRSGRFRQDIERIGARFEGPVAIVEAKGDHKTLPEKSDLDVLVPINGTKMARHGAEVAMAIARVVRAPLRVIYVSEAADRARAGRRSGTPMRWHEQAVLKDIVELADSQDLEIKTAVRSATAAKNAILSEVGHNADRLIVMGVARPVGETLFFGEIAAAVLAESPASVLLVAS